MPTACDHKPDASRYWQLQQNDPNGDVNCTAYAAAAAADYDTCGSTLLKGKDIRAKSTEPTPDDESPGLHLTQVRDAVLKLTRNEVDLKKYTGSMALDWEEYEDRRKAGHGFVIQLSYATILPSELQASTSFKRGHAMFESPESTYDPLADGRRVGGVRMHRFDGRLYPRELMKKAAGQFVIARDSAGRPTRRVGVGKVWCAMTRDRRSGHSHAAPDTGRNEMIITEGLNLASSHVMALKKGTPLRRANQPGSTIVTTMSHDANVAYFGIAGNGMAAVLVRTVDDFADRNLRPVIVYVARTAGEVRPR